MAEIREDLMDVAAEIRDAIDKLTTEIKYTRLAITSMNATLQEVIDPGARENFPGYIRVKNIGD